MRTPRTRPSRSRPRNPGQSSDAFTDSAAGTAIGRSSLFNASATAAAGVAFGVADADGVAGGATAIGAGGGASSPSARTRSSAVGVHRHERSLSNAPVKPPVRTIVHTAHAATIAATMVARCTPIDQRRLTTAQATNARQMPGMASIGKIMPIAPVASDTSRNGNVAAIAAIIRTIAAMRSNHAARLKNSHQTAIAKNPANPPMTAYIVWSGATIGIPNRASHCAATIATPGHRRRGLDEGDSDDRSLLMMFLQRSRALSAVDEISQTANAIED